MPNIFNLGGEGKNAAFKKDIIKYFVANGNSTIQELAKDTLLSVPTVTKAVTELIELGYIVEYGKQETSEAAARYCTGLIPNRVSLSVSRLRSTLSTSD